MVSTVSCQDLPSHQESQNHEGTPAGDHKIESHPKMILIYVQIFHVSFIFKVFDSIHMLLIWRCGMSKSQCVNSYKSKCSYVMLS